MSEKNVTLDRYNIEKITKQAKALEAEYLRQYRAATTLEIAHEKARRYLQNGLPARPGAF
jgi:hypothetical protein